MSARSLVAVLAFLLLCAPAVVRAKASTDLVTPDELHTASGGRVWVYLPKNTPAKVRLPCVLIAPAGSRMFHGMTLGEGDQAEHLPWVAAGFAVVSYDISGPVDGQAESAQIKRAAADFLKARFGVSDGLAALDAALAKYPQLDPNRLYLAGHSSAATLALQLAAASDRFKGCVAFAPCTDVEDHLKSVLPILDRAVPGFAAALHSASPVNAADAIKCPVFLFHAQDDERISTASIEAYRDALLAHHKTADYVTAASGGHYESMIEQGVPKAIAWMQALDQKASGRKP